MTQEKPKKLSEREGKIRERGKRETERQREGDKERKQGREGNWFGFLSNALESFC